MREVLLVADRPGWAIERKADNLICVLGDRFRMRKGFPEELREEDLDRADLVQVFFWMQFQRMERLEEAFQRHAAKLLVGVCAHVDLEGARREPGLAVLRRARAVFANNPRLVEETRLLLGRPVQHTPNGVDTSFFRPGEAASVGNELRVGWAGSLSNQGPEQRGFPNLIVPAVEGLPGARLVTAIREERWRTLAEMSEFYQGIDVYLCASRSEGTPNPCLEAAACGVPLVTTRVGNMPEFVRDGVNGFFVEPSVEDIRDRLALLAADPELRLSMGQAARETAEGWDWSRMAESYRAMYESVAPGLPPAVS